MVLLKHYLSADRLKYGSFFTVNYFLYWLVVHVLVSNNDITIDLCCFCLMYLYMFTLLLLLHVLYYIV